MRLVGENNVLCAKVPFSYVLVVKGLEVGCLLLLLTINLVPQMIQIVNPYSYSRLNDM